MMNPVIDTENLKHYDQLLKAVAGGSLSKSEDGTKLVLKSVDGTMLSEVDAPSGGSGEDCLKTTGGVFNGTTEFSPATEDTPAKVGTFFHIEEGSVLQISTRNHTDTENVNAGIVLDKDDDNGDIVEIGALVSKEGSNITSQLFVAPGTAGIICQAGGFPNMLILESGSYVPQTIMGNVVTSVNGVSADNFGNVSLDSLAVDTSALVLKAGKRGTLAGYETNGTNTTIDQSAPDSNQTGSDVTVSNGTSGTSWTKIVRVTKDVSVTLGTSWQWSGGEAPVIVAGGILVCCWCGSGGVASFVSPV